MDLAKRDFAQVMTSRSLGRTAGLLYLAIIASGIFAELAVRGRLIDVGNAESTARNILAHQSFYGMGIVADLLMVACDLALSAMLYTLFASYSRVGALAMTLLRLTPVGMLAVKSLFAAAVVPILSGRIPLDAFSLAQREDIALLMLRLHDQLYSLAMVFFGLNLLALGLLIIRSGLVPRMIGLFLIIGGLCDLVVRVPPLIDRTLAASIPAVFGFGPLAAELALAGWLLVVGWRRFESNTDITPPVSRG